MAVEGGGESEHPQHGRGAERGADDGGQPGEENVHEFPPSGGVAVAVAEVGGGGHADYGGHDPSDPGKEEPRDREEVGVSELHAKFCGCP